MPLVLTLLAPEIVEAFLDGRQPEGMQLDDPPEGFSLGWNGQAGHFEGRRNRPPERTAT
jgi:hypothetical protein